MTFMDKVKAKAEEWDVQGKAEKFAAEVDKVAHEAKDRAATLADENRDKVASTLDKAGASIDQRTEGKYSEKITKAKSSVAKGVDKLAEQRPGGPQGPKTPSGTGATAGTGAADTTKPTDAWSDATRDGGAAAKSSVPEPYTPEPYTADPIDAAEPIDPAQSTESGIGWPQDAPPRTTEGGPR